MKGRIAALVVVVGIAGVYYLYFYPRTTAEVESTAADGMFRARIVERSSNAGEGHADIFLDRWNESGWEEFRHERISNDSLTRSVYSVDWHYDDKQVPQGVRVYGSFGTRPLDPEVIFTWRVAAK